MGLDVGVVVLGGQAAYPAVEQLQRPRAGRGLRRQKATREVGEPVQQLVPGVGFLVHERLGASESAASPSPPPPPPAPPHKDAPRGGRPSPPCGAGGGPPSPPPPPPPENSAPPPPPPPPPP